MKAKILIVPALLICMTLAATPPPSLNSTEHIPLANEKIDDLPLSHQAPPKKEKKLNSQGIALIGATLITLTLGLIFTGSDTGKRASTAN